MNTDKSGEAQRLAQLLRELDGDHKLGAGALAEALVAHGVWVGAESPSAPREASARLLQLIADYGKANFECGNRFSDDPDVNAGANDRANEAWLAILDAVGAVDRGAPSPSAPTKHHDYRAPVCWCGERNSGGSTPEHEGNPE